MTRIIYNSRDMYFERDKFVESFFTGRNAKLGSKEANAKIVRMEGIV